MTIKNEAINQSTEIINGIITGKFTTYVDDHNGGTDIDTVDGFVVLKADKNTDTEFWICPVSRSWRYFCLNPLYIDKEDGLLHLSTGSVAGNVMPGNHGMDMVEAVRAYNAEGPFKEIVNLWLHEELSLVKV